jgi:hypothetical protein
MRRLNNRQAARHRLAAAPRLAPLGSLILLAGCTLVVGDVDPRDVVHEKGCADVQSDPRNCGVCGLDCTLLPGVDSAAVRCVAGQCDLRNACRPGRADCTSQPGCESDLSDAAHCGNCQSMCSGTTALCTRTSGGLYTCTAMCALGATQCGSSCTDVSSDPQHCGSCLNACGAPAHALAICTFGGCDFQCDSGFVREGGGCVQPAATDLRSVDLRSVDLRSGADMTLATDLTADDALSLGDGPGSLCLLVACTDVSTCVMFGCSSCSPFTGTCL